MLELDHVAVLGETLQAAVGHVEGVLGCAMGPGGAHARFGTHNRLIGLAPELYLEAIAVDPAASPPGDARWFGLDRFRGAPRLDKWIARVPDMDAALDAFPEAGRKVALSRGDLHWEMAVPEDGQLPFDGLFPALICWKSPVPPGRRLAAEGRALRRLVVSHPRAEALAARLCPHLSAPLVAFETGPAGLVAEIATGQGVVRLG
ncbi:polyphosphate kinase [Pseudoponticoccus marisrubri]|uniref:Polyphosphate kinase n=2 Tax=Pseudoponticoccus marisrubri TaxID=1685382 RepID=A0A0W7WN86_9RHOB|nr:polyphosphate kinase [Pseudoponticoccus marisrubri]